MPDERIQFPPNAPFGFVRGECACPERITDAVNYGFHACKDGKRIAPEDLYPSPPVVDDGRQSLGASPEGDRATHERGQSSLSPPPVGIPSAERRQIVAFLSWWAKDQSHQADTTVDFDKEVEFSIRAAALADAARDILDFGDVRFASAIEARRAATPESGAVHESAVPKGDAQ